MTSDAALVALVALPAAVGAVLCLLAALGPANERSAQGGRPARAAVAASLTTATAVLVLAVVVAVQRPAVGATYLAGATLQLDVGGLAALFAPTVAAITLLVLVFAAADLGSDPAAAGGSAARFHGLMLLFASAALLTVVAGTLPTLLVAWEVMGATSYALIGFRWRDPHRVSSGLVAFVTTRTADLGLYVAAGAALAGGAGMALADLDQASSGWRDVIAVGVAVAALGQGRPAAVLVLAQPGHGRPEPGQRAAALRSHGGAGRLPPAPGRAAAGRHRMGRRRGRLDRGRDRRAARRGGGRPAGPQAAAGRLHGCPARIRGARCGRGLGGGWGDPPGRPRRGEVPALPGRRGLARRARDQGSRAATGAARRWPLVGAVATAGLLSLAGVVPLALWATKDEILAAASDRSPALYVTGLAGAALAACYAGKALAMLLARRPADAPDGPDALPRWVRLPLVPLALGAVSLELLALPPVGDHVRRLVGDTTSATATPAEMAVSAVVASRRWSSPWSWCTGPGAPDCPPACSSGGWAWRPRPAGSSSDRLSAWPGRSPRPTTASSTGRSGWSRPGACARAAPSGHWTGAGSTAPCARSRAAYAGPATRSPPPRAGSCTTTTCRRWPSSVSSFSSSSLSA